MVFCRIRVIICSVGKADLNTTRSKLLLLLWFPLNFSFFCFSVLTVNYDVRSDLHNRSVRRVKMRDSCKGRSKYNPIRHQQETGNGKPSCYDSNTLSRVTQLMNVHLKDWKSQVTNEAQHISTSKESIAIINIKLPTQDYQLNLSIAIHLLASDIANYEVYDAHGASRNHKQVRNSVPNNGHKTIEAHSSIALQVILV